MIAIENGPVEIVDFPIKSMVIFHSYVNVYQRVSYFYINFPMEIAIDDVWCGMMGYGPGGLMVV